MTTPFEAPGRLPGTTLRADKTRTGEIGILTTDTVNCQVFLDHEQALLLWAWLTRALTP